MTGFSNSAATSRMMWMDSASSCLRWVRWCAVTPRMPFPGPFRVPILAIGPPEVHPGSGGGIFIIPVHAASCAVQSGEVHPRVMESKKIGIFRNATDAVHFSQGQTIFKEGDPATLMYVVQSGEVEITHKEMLIETLVEGNIFGEMSLVS